MGDSYREELKRTSRQRKATDPARGNRTRAAADKRSKAIKRQQGREALRARYAKTPVQGTLM